mgnify:CR=1 FL=1
MRNYTNPKTATAAGGAAGQMRDVAVGECLLQFCDSCVGDLGALELERP